MSQARNISRGTGTSANNLVALNSSAQLPAGIGAGGNIQTQLFTASGTWTAPSGVTKVRATVVGGGGGASTSSCGQVGASGGVAIGIYTVVSGTGYTITVGAGGTAGSSGGAGGTSSFASFCSATGGSGGTTSTPGTPGAGSSGNLRNSVAAVPFTITPVFSVPGILSGSSKNYVNSSNVVQAFSINTNLAPGAGGGDSTGAFAGVGGAVLLEWVG